MFTYSYIFSIMVIPPIVMLIAQRTRLIMSLLALEAIMLTIIFYISSSLIMPANSIFFILILLSFSACEASLGLSLLVLMSRTYGSDMISLLSSNKC